MSSSTSAGERRWSSARKSGMTVLGKVPVPKPMNLPSQRLESHGLDPNVEIVPKGSPSWGSRSSSASNPWGVSPNGDGTVSPSHLNGRPSSSSGSVTRPSTAGSDRVHESAWGPNSRPSSASGPLISNQALPAASSRPRSADTRPGSSQLSRFAEPAAESSVAWGSTGTVEKLVLHRKSDNFSLSSGDFPTLGKNPESEDNHSHGRPSSASGRVASPNDRGQTEVKGGIIDTWTRDDAQHVEDGVHPSAEKWHGDHPQYRNPNMPPQHFDSWRGPPMNPPAGVWYGGPPGGPPYPPVPHGGFPIESFPYYRPQIPPPLANPQPVPSRGPGPRGHHPKNGDFHRPHMPDAFMHPGLPMRPGFYPGSVPYDGYYGPPMGYNPNEREIPFMGMPGGPSIYNMYPPQNSFDPGDIQTRVGAGRGTGGGKRLVTEHAGLGHSDDSRGPFKVLKKLPNEWGLEEEENLESTASATALHLEKGEQPRKASLKNEWGADNRTDGEFYSGRATQSENHSSRTSLNQGRSSEPGILKSPRDKSKATDESWGKKSEIALPEVLPAASKDTTLIQKIEMLNAKVRAFDGRKDTATSSVRDEQMNRVRLVDTKTNNHSMNEAGGIPRDSFSSLPKLGGSTEETSSQTTADSVSTIQRRSHTWVHGRMDHQHRGRFNNHDADGWRKKTPSLASESSSAVPAVNHVTVEAAEKREIRVSGKNEEESLTPMFDSIEGQVQRAKMRELAQQRAIQRQKEEEELIREQKAKALAKLEELNRRMLAGDCSAQKLEMPVTSGAAQKDLEELKKNPGPVMDADTHVTEQLENPLTSRATRLDPEESQNHPVQVMDVDKHSAQKFSKSVPSGATQWNSKESRKQPGPVIDVDKCELPISVSTPNAQVVGQTSAGITGGAGESSLLLRDLHFEAPNVTNKEHVVSHAQSVSSKLDGVNTGIDDSETASNDFSQRRNKHNKQKQSIYVEINASDTQKQRSQVESTVTDRPTSISTSVAEKGHIVGASEIVTSQVDPPINSESVGPNKRKNNRSSRNKHKQDEAASSTASQLTVPPETHLTKASPTTLSQLPAQKETFLSKVSVTATLQAHVKKETLPDKASGTASSQAHFTDVKDANQQPSSEQSSILPGEGAYGRVNNQWKPQNSRRMPRNPQALKPGDKFHSSESVMWAPVRSQNKQEPEGESSHKAAPDATPATATNGNPVQSSVKNKRAELERYVPKPVAKELAQQGSIPQLVPLSSSTLTSNVTSDREGSGSQSVNPEVGNGRSSLEQRNEDYKQSKPTRTPGWRQRASSEVQHEKGIQQTSSKNVQKSMNQQHTPKPEFNFVPAENKVCHDWDPSDGWSMPEEPSVTATVTHVVEDVGTGKGRRQPYKSNRNTVNSHDFDHRSNSSGGEADKNHTHSAATDINQAERIVSYREGRDSHWQPKSQANPASNQRGSRYDGGQKDYFQVKKNSSPRGSSEITDQPLSEQIVSENRKVEEASNVRHEEARRERRPDSSRRHPRTPNHSFGPPDNMEEQCADQHYSGFRRSGFQYNRGSGRGNESRRDWSGHENNRPQQHVGPSRDRQNANFEYQPVGSNNSNAKFSKLDGEGSRNIGPARYQERGSGRPRHGAGNFHGQQQSGNIRVDAGNE